MGHSQAEIDDAQARWGLRFPPDLVDLLHEHRTLPVRPPGKLGSFTCMDVRPEVIRNWLDWPLNTFCDHLRHNPEQWWPEWGARPADEETRRSVVKSVLDIAPRMIPILGHRLLPEDPCETRNPVFSVAGTDTIYFGANLNDWLSRELAEPGTGHLLPWPAIKPIRFWADAVRHGPFSEDSGQAPF